MLLFGITHILYSYEELTNKRGLHMEYITAKEAANKWNISERRVQVLCEQGRIEGVQRFGKAWAIPQNAAKPSDSRIKQKGD